MKKILILLTGFMIFVLNVAFGHECKEIHTHDTHNVGHQFYDALIETPKDALVKGAVATKDLTKAVAATVVFSNAAHELKDAAKELVIDTPVKTAYAIKNGALKAYDSTKEGAKTVYENAVVKPAHTIKHVAYDIAESDFVQGTKETAVEVGQQFKEAGQDAWDATKSGVKRVYHLLVQKPIGAVKAAGHYLAHGDEDEIIHHHPSHSAIIPSEKYVMVCDEPCLACTEVVASTNANGVCPQSQRPITTVSIMTPEIAQTIIPGLPSQLLNNTSSVKVELLVARNKNANPNVALSEKSLNLLSQTYDSVALDLS